MWDESTRKRHTKEKVTGTWRSKRDAHENLRDLPQVRGRFFSPLDEELGLLPGNLAPRQQEHVIHLACWMPFDKAADMVERLLGVQTNEETVRRLTERTGKWMQEAQTAALEAEEEDQKDYLQVCALSPDGALIPLTHKQWAEARTVAIGEPEEKVNAKGEKEIHVGKLSYFSRLVDASTFIDLVQVELQRRGVFSAKRVGAIMDGADWCQTLVDMHRPDAVRILDLPHGAGYINNLLEALRKADVHFPGEMLDRTLHVLKHRGPHSLFRMADRLPDDLAQKEEVRVPLNYLRKREAMMQYQKFRRDGWPIGSGMVESANKNVVEMRLKGPGMHWERKNVNPMLALRNAVCNERWLEMWQKAFKQYQLQEASLRKSRAEQRAQAHRAASDAQSGESPPPSENRSSPGASPDKPLQPVSLKRSLPAPGAEQRREARRVASLDSPVPSQPLPPDKPLPPASEKRSLPLPVPQEAATLPSSSRPSPHHPWKRGPACRPKAV